MLGALASSHPCGTPRVVKPQGTRLYPFVPSGPDFALAVEFFAALGFEKTWQEGGLAGLRFGDAYFLLQDIDSPEWQKNQQITFEVSDLDAYWSELESKDLAGTFAGVKVRPPTDFPWGREIHFIDPGGVCWHVRQSKQAAPMSTSGFPPFAKAPANRIAASAQFTDDIEGYVFDGADGSQVALWTAHADRVSTEHTHDFDEYVLVIEGRCTVIIGEARTELRAGQEMIIPRGTRQSMEVAAGTRTMHVFGGKRAQRAGEV
jgi:quercetin dioxygenase-like cupin family protein